MGCRVKFILEVYDVLLEVFLHLVAHYSCEALQILDDHETEETIEATDTVDSHRTLQLCECLNSHQLPYGAWLEPRAHLVQITKASVIDTNNKYFK